jgi:hypothetical protein
LREVKDENTSLIQRINELTHQLTDLKMENVDLKTSLKVYENKGKESN